MTGEEIGREKKAKKLVRGMLALLLVEVRNPENTMLELAVACGYDHVSDAIRTKVIEILEGIAI